tara:strand:+ start:42171 stop:42377 length:207 start_codon:yes stop_codon:yes gene_type:complete
MSDWISVDDELPTKIKGSPFSLPCIAYCPFDKCQYTSLLLDGIFVHFETGRVIHGGVTHWMQLPAPPK